MKKLPIAALLLTLSSVSLGQNARIVNAVSLSSVSISPGSIISILGTQLTTGVSFATNVPTPPTTLGGVTVAIGGAAAELFYVSPTQINAVVNPTTPTSTDAHHVE